jgi:hypothetical protein
VADARNLRQNRRLMGIRWYETPAFMLLSLAVRPLEMVGMYWQLVHPASCARFVSRNFA